MPGCNLTVLSYVMCSYSYGRVYAADPYNHTLTPAATYSVGAMVRLSCLPHVSVLSMPGPLHVMRHPISHLQSISNRFYFFLISKNTRSN